MLFRACKFLPFTLLIPVILTTQPQQICRRKSTRRRSPRRKICSQPHRGTIRRLEAVRTKDLRPDIFATARKGPEALGPRQLGKRRAEAKACVHHPRRTPRLPVCFAGALDRNPRSLLREVRVRAIDRDWPRSHTNRHGDAHTKPNTSFKTILSAATVQSSVHRRMLKKFTTSSRMKLWLKRLRSQPPRQL
jgi:hypothetical protein